jgi:hypothetical protein
MSESSIRRIYSIVPEDPSEIRPERFPSLKTFAGRSFARNLVRTLKQIDLDEFWNNEVWKIFRFQLFYFIVMEKSCVLSFSFYVMEMWEVSFKFFVSGFTLVVETFSFILHRQISSFNFCIAFILL